VVKLKYRKLYKGVPHLFNGGSDIGAGGELWSIIPTMNYPVLSLAYKMEIRENRRKS
jgi:hypothetical protein